MILYTSDLHFGHANVIGLDQRPFDSVEEMDQRLIEYWNARVQPNDTVYIVGDVCFRNRQPAQWYLQQLKGRKFLVPGNHDAPLLENREALCCLEGVESIMNIRDGDRDICLCHYPLAEWPGYYRGHWHIYGHIHNKRNEAFGIMRNKENALNAGCMINGFMPVSFQELLDNNRAFMMAGLER